MKDIIIVEFYEERPIRFSTSTQRVKVREIDPSQLTIIELDELIETQKRLGRTYEINRQTS